jgi:hypothetical protein
VAAASQIRELLARLVVQGEASVDSDTQTAQFSGLAASASATVAALLDRFLGISCVEPVSPLKSWLSMAEPREGAPDPVNLLHRLDANAEVEATIHQLSKDAVDDAEFAEVVQDADGLKEAAVKTKAAVPVFKVDLLSLKVDIVESPTTFSKTGEPEEEPEDTFASEMGAGGKCSARGSEVSRPTWTSEDTRNAAVSNLGVRSSALSCCWGFF